MHTAPAQARAPIAISMKQHAGQRQWRVRSAASPEAPKLAQTVADIFLRHQQERERHAKEREQEKAVLNELFSDKPFSSELEEKMEKIVEKEERRLKQRKRRATLAWYKKQARLAASATTSTGADIGITWFQPEQRLPWMVVDLLLLENDQGFFFNSKGRYTPDTVFVTVSVVVVLLFLLPFFTVSVLYSVYLKTTKKQSTTCPGENDKKMPLPFSRNCKVMPPPPGLEHPALRGGSEADVFSKLSRTHAGNWGRRQRRRGRQWQ